MTSIVILGFFAIIAVAGTHAAVQGASNVVVTNSTTQPVPIAVQGTPGVTVKNPPLSPVPVNIVTHGKDGYQYFTSVSFSQNDTNNTTTYSGIPGERFVITNISLNMVGGNLAQPGYAEFNVMTKSTNTILTDKIIPIVPYTGDAFRSFADQQTLILLDPTNKLAISVIRNGSGVSGTCNVTLTGYRVTYP
jgi:hypothetical protein